MCQSLASPSCDAYWHIGDSTMRLSSVMPRSVIGENSLQSAIAIGLFGSLLGNTKLWNRLVPAGDLRRGVFREVVRTAVGHGHAALVDAIPEVRPFAYLPDLRREPFYGVARRARRGVDPIPGVDLKSRKPGLGGRRNVRQLRMTG